MRDWRHVIQQWIAQESSIAPLAQQQVEFIAWAIYPPSFDHWPSHLPTCQALQDFYRLCDGDISTGSVGFPFPNLLSRIVSGSNS